ncbi:virulence factor MviN [Methylosinus sp. H3A]|uniref:lipid II flippase MurJ n=1 Tax=Methylosinus sp. H3A TaxID=2785786 RepID=UPI0018C1D011|nr:lipid II flippase MurJ [Methylosinus sp. H3A]MBG0809455.1 virulence factor MviN [Methylosinus sp. H3A]
MSWTQRLRDAALVAPRLPHSAAAPARVASPRKMAVLLMLGALASKILGFAREILMAQVLGASLLADGYRGAVTVILLPLCFLQNESAPAILIPMLQRAQREGNAPRLLASLCCALTLAAFAVMLGVQALGAWWIDVMLSGFSPEGKALTLSYVRIMSWAMPASVLLNTLAAGEIALGETRLSNLRAGLLNLSMIIGLALYSVIGWFGALAWPFTLSFNALALFGLWLRYREQTLDPGGLRPAAIFAAGREFVWRLRPLLALPFAEQAQVWVERLAASRNVTGAVASLDYSRTLSDTASLLISQPVGLAYMSSYRNDESHHQIEGIVRLILAVTVPASAFVYVFAPDIVRLVFFRGAFSETGLLLTSSALQGVSIGLWASTLGWILVRRLNSEGRNGRVTLIVVGAYLVNIALNAIGAWLAPPLGLGLLLIGLGESARSLTLLVGATWALPNRRRILSLTCIAAGSGAGMLIVGRLIEAQASASASRLFAGGVACAFWTLVGAFVLLPDLRRLCVSKLRILLARGERP